MPAVAFFVPSVGRPARVSGRASGSVRVTLGHDPGNSCHGYTRDQRFGPARGHQAGPDKGSQAARRFRRMGKYRVDGSFDDRLINSRITASERVACRPSCVVCVPPGDRPKMGAPPQTVFYHDGKGVPVRRGI
jgi:hypothetical protein